MPPPHKHAWTAYEPVGRTFTDGLETLHLYGKRKAVIDSVTLLPGHDDAGLKLIGVRLVGPGRGANIQEMPWPPRDPDLMMSKVGPAVGATITPESHNGDNWELLLGHQGHQAGLSSVSWGPGRLPHR